MKANHKHFLQVQDLKKYYRADSGFFWHRAKDSVKAVDGISFSVQEGQTFGLVGESGCGKSTVTRLILRLTLPTGGKVFYQGRDLFSLSRKQMFDIRREMQIIFQDPFASLSPRMTVGEIVSEPMEIHRVGDKAYRRKRVASLMEVVNLRPEHINRYPHQFSGGQRQRIGIARALALKPRLIICDEPVSALDVSVQAQILNLLTDLQKTFGLTYLFIAHDLSAVKHISSKIGVMYLGKIVEIAQSGDLYQKPLHPYTMGLMSAIPLPDPVQERQRKRILLSGDVPSPIHPPSGCRFHPRCPLAADICKSQEPELTDYGSGGKRHLAACFFAGKPLS